MLLWTLRLVHAHLLPEGLAPVLHQLHTAMELLPANQKSSPVFIAGKPLQVPQLRL